MPPMRRYSETPFSILNLLQDIVVSLLSIRFVLAFAGAAHANAVAEFFRHASQPLAEPFRGMLPATIVQGFSVEWYTVAAIVVCVALTFAVMHVLALLTQIVDDDEALVYRRQHAAHRGHRHA